MTDREKEIEKKIREFDRLQLLTELRFKRLKEINESIKFIEDQHTERLRSFVTSLPPLPPGWRYEYEQEMIYNEEMKTYDCKLIATPRQMYKIEEDEK